MTTLVDVFPIYFDLQAFSLTAFQIKADNSNEIGATFAAQVRSRRRIPCAWVKNECVLIVPSTFSSKNANEVLHELWNAKIEGFDQVIAIDDLVGWQATAESVAQFVAIGMSDKAQNSIRPMLKTEKLTVKMINVERVADFKGVVVNGEPALQITVRSNMDSTVKLSAVFNPQHPTDSIKNMAVKCKNTRGIAQKQIGVLDAQMKLKLKGYNPKDYDATILDRLPSDHPIIEVKKTFGSKKYFYPLEVLEVAVDMGNLSSFGLTQAEINKITYRLKIVPDARFKLVSNIRDSFLSFLVKEFPSIRIGERYSSDIQPELFATSNELGLQSELRFATGTSEITKDTDLFRAIRKYGIYKKPQRFESDNQIKIGVVDLIVGTEHYDQRTAQLLRFMGFMKSQNLMMKRSSAPINIQGTSTFSSMALRAELTSALKKIISSGTDLILVYLPDEDYNFGNDDTDNEISLYDTAKSICIQAGVASQMISASTIGDEWSDDNIIIGMLGKIGFIPYILANPIEYTDLVVGLDVSRQTKANARGTTNTAAMSRIYVNTGEMAGYSASGMSIEGEIIPRVVLERILPEDRFGNSTCIVHRDGRFVGQELENIMEWGEQIKAEFMPMEVTKSGVARLYKRDNLGSIVQADKGDTFFLSNTSAYMISSLPPKGKTGYSSTARPLQITNYSRLTIYEALNSVLNLTLLHYGSVRPPRLPVSTHASDKIAGFLNQLGIGSVSGDVPFWL